MGRVSAEGARVEGSRSVLMSSFLLVHTKHIHEPLNLSKTIYIFLMSIKNYKTTKINQKTVRDIKNYNSLIESGNSFDGFRQGIY